MIVLSILNAVNNGIWRAIAWFATRQPVTQWLIRRAQRTPYTPIKGPDGSTYMGRWWLFNPYPAPGVYRRAGWRDWLPSVRIHHIMRPDTDRHLHDHPWNARTIVLRGHYVEERRVAQTPVGVDYTPTWTADGTLRAKFKRQPGYTGRLLFGEYHRISEVSDSGVWTMFWTWGYRGTWGFLVEGDKVPYKRYLGLPDA